MVVDNNVRHDKDKLKLLGKKRHSLPAKRTFFRCQFSNTKRIRYQGNTMYTSYRQQVYGEMECYFVKYWNDVNPSITGKSCSYPYNKMYHQKLNHF